MRKIGWIVLGRFVLGIVLGIGLIFTKSKRLTPAGPGPGPGPARKKECTEIEGCKVGETCHDNG